MVVPYDLALDRELWRWMPPGGSLLLTRTPWSALPVGLDQARTVGDVDVVAGCARSVLATGPDVVTYGCTSGSFVRGMSGEQEIVDGLLHAGAPVATTTSGSLLEALAVLGVHRVAVTTPYDAAVSARLDDFLSEAGHVVTARRHLGLTGRIWTVPEEVTADLVRATVTADTEAVVVSCTNVPTYDVIAPLEAELGIPVLTANQVTMWGALRRTGARAVGPGQALLERTPMPVVTP